MENENDNDYGFGDENQKDSAQPENEGSSRQNGTQSDFGKDTLQPSGYVINGQQIYTQNEYSQQNDDQTLGGYGNQRDGFNPQQPYGQQNYNYGGQGYQGGYGAGTPPTDKNGQPLQNRYGMKLTFSILEIICCNIISLICGIIACINTGKANISYRQGRWEEFQSQSKAAAISLWIGLAGFILEVIFIIVVIVMGASMYSKMWDQYNASPNSSYSYNQDDNNDSYHYGSDAEPENNSKAKIGSEETEQVQPETKGEVSDAIIPGTGFTDPTITIKGITVTLPLSYSDLKALGLYIEGEDEEYTVNANEYYYPDVYTPAGEKIGYVYIGNQTEEAIPMKEGIVFGFRIDIEEEGETPFSFNNGVTAQASKEDLYAAFGEPDNVYQSGLEEDYDSQTYTWYNHSDEYYDSNQNSIEFGYWDGKMSKLVIYYIGWE